MEIGTKNVCGRCGELNVINAGNIKEIDLKDAGGRYFKLTYVFCKRCKEIMPLQIDDVETIEIYKKLKRHIVKVAKKQMRHEDVTKEDIKKKDRLTEKLKEKRLILKNGVSGKEFYLLDGEIFINPLTFPKVGDII